MSETEKKIKKSILRKAAKKASAEEAKKNGRASATLNNVPSSPRKMRLVADIIRGERVSKALHILKYESKHPSHKLEKLLLSAINNWELKYPDLKLEDMDLFVKEIYVNGGRMLKRIRTAPQGRAHRIRKRSNHVKLVIDSHKEVETTQVSTSKKETKK